ncbi:MAG TPA: hypothetical protein VGV61_08915 [Thermoanaerobaculia bacterium]|nr:hypothetical protein [Thermoanaerobaculia bacterium]
MEALEAALARRSRELRTIVRHVCRRDLAIIARVQAGLAIPALASCDAELWNETTETTSADVEEALQTLWHSLVPAETTDDGDSGP